MRLNRAIAALVLLAGCLFVVLVQAQGTTAAGGGAGTAVELPAFGNITSCLPLNVLVKPSAQGSSNAYSLATDAGAEVAAALRAVVVNGTLFLGFNKSFESTTPIRVTVSLPADKLQTVENKGVGQLIINPGECLVVRGTEGARGWWSAGTSRQRQLRCMERRAGHGADAAAIACNSHARCDYAAAYVC